MIHHGWSKSHSYSRNENGERTEEVLITVWTQPSRLYWRWKLFHKMHSLVEKVPLCHRLIDRIQVPIRPWKRKITQARRFGDPEPVGKPFRFTMPLCAHWDCICFDLAHRERKVVGEFAVHDDDLGPDGGEDW